MSPPTEVDGWRIMQDPYYKTVWWRMRGFTLEYAHWLPAYDRSAWSFGEWHPQNEHREAWLSYSGATERRAVWQALFLNP